MIFDNRIDNLVDTKPLQGLGNQLDSLLSTNSDCISLPTINTEELSMDINCKSSCRDNVSLDDTEHVSPDDKFDDEIDDSLLEDSIDSDLSDIDDDSIDDDGFAEGFGVMSYKEIEDAAFNTDDDDDTFGDSNEDDDGDTFRDSDEDDDPLDFDDDYGDDDEDIA